MKNNVLFETEFWRVILADDQYYLGRMYVSVKRNVGALRDLTPKEWNDLHKNVIVKLENSLIKSFRADVFNWTCLMNNEYKSENPEPHVHFHLWPRYKNSVRFAGEIFIDEVFGHHYDKYKSKKVNQEVFDKIADNIKNNLPTKS